MSILQIPLRGQIPIPMQNLLLLPRSAMSAFDEDVNVYDCPCCYANVRVHARAFLQNHDVGVHVEFQLDLPPFPSRISKPIFLEQRQRHNSSKFEVSV